MSNPPPLPKKSNQVPSQELEVQVGDCWSCRALSGGGLLASGAYVIRQARKYRNPSSPTGAVVQILFGTVLAAGGVAVIADIPGRLRRL